MVCLATLCSCLIGQALISYGYSQPTTLEEETVRLHILDIYTGIQYDGTYPLSATLRDVIIDIITSGMGLDPSMHYKYYLATTPMGTPLDNSKTLEESGITQDGTVLFFHKWDCVKIYWLDLQTGGTYNEEFPLQATLLEVKIITLENWLGVDPSMHYKYFVTTAPAPTTECDPIVMRSITTAPIPMCVALPI